MRPCRARLIAAAPPCVVYKPAGVPARDLTWAALALDEFEALRLCDALGMDQAAAAECMGVSRPTLGRVLERARRTVATALALGQALQISGGPVALREQPCCRRRAQGRGGCRCNQEPIIHSTGGSDGPSTNNE